MQSAQPSLKRSQKGTVFPLVRTSHNKNMHANAISADSSGAIEFAIGSGRPNLGLRTARSPVRPVPPLSGDRAAWRTGKVKAPMRTARQATLRVISLSNAVVVVALSAAWIFGAFAALGLTPLGQLGVALAVVIACELFIGLMALLFYSDSSGQDEAAFHVQEVDNVERHQGQ